MLLTLPKNHQNGYCINTMQSTLLHDPMGRDSMNVSQLWKKVAALTEPFVTTEEPSGFDNVGLERLARSLDCYLLLYRVNDLTPCFVSHSLSRFLLLNDCGITPKALLQFIGRQTQPIIPAWIRVVAELQIKSIHPKLLALCLADVQLQNVWCAGSYGLVTTPPNNTPVVMAIFYDLDRLGPIGITDLNAQKIEDELGKRFSLLSLREREVLAHILDEKTVSQMASEMFLSINTVNSHRKNLMTKLAVRSNLGLVIYRPFLQW